MVDWWWLQTFWAPFHNMAGIMPINGGTRLGASENFHDFQDLKQVLCQMVDEELSGDGPSYSSTAIHSWLTLATKTNP